MNNLNEIQSFFASGKLAIAGASRNEKKFGGYVLKELKGKGIELYPVNPNAKEIQGIKCYNSVSELPSDVKSLYIVTSKSEVKGIIEEGAAKGMERVWIQQGAESEEAIEAAQKAGIPVISKKCIMMFAGPVKGVHAFHGFMARIFGRYPKFVHV